MIHKQLHLTDTIVNSRDNTTLMTSQMQLKQPPYPPCRVKPYGFDVVRTKFIYLQYRCVHGTSGVLDPAHSHLSHMTIRRATALIHVCMYCTKYVTPTPYPSDSRVIICSILAAVLMITVISYLYAFFIIHRIHVSGLIVPLQLHCTWRRCQF